MSYEIKCTKYQLDILEQNNIDFEYYDAIILVSNRTTIEVKISDIVEYNKACILIKNSLN